MVPGTELFSIPMIYLATYPFIISTIIQVAGPMINNWYFEGVTGLTIGYYHFGFDFWRPWGWILILLTTIFETPILLALIGKEAIELTVFLLPQRGYHIACNQLIWVKTILIDWVANFGIIPQDAKMFRKWNDDVNNPNYPDTIDSDDIMNDCIWYYDVALEYLAPYREFPFSVLDDYY